MATKTKIILGIIIFLVLVGGGFYVWNKYTGRFKIGADAIMGCQNPNLVSSFMGKPGTNLVTYNLFGHDVSVNEKIVGSLDAVQSDVNAAKTGYNFNDIQTYNYRGKTGGGGLSLHSWGIAIDINPSQNPFQSGKYDAAQTDIPVTIIDIFRKHGFQWGGDWPGQRDPMHFEWYGSEVSGSTLDANSGQKIIADVAVIADDWPMPWANGDFNWILPATHSHTVTVTARGYENAKFDFETFCFQSKNMDISLKPLADNVPGSISGRVTVSGGRSPVIPATIYLDGKIVGTSNTDGTYVISNVHGGQHKVGAKILFFPGTEITAPDLAPQENIKNLNIVIGS